MSQINTAQAVLHMRHVIPREDHDSTGDYAVCARQLFIEVKDSSNELAQKVKEHDDELLQHSNHPNDDLYQNNVQS